MSLPRYPRYKDSGAPWLGAVPTHWAVKRFKWLISRNDGGVWGEDPDGENDTFVLRSTEQTVDGHWKLEEAAQRKLSESEKFSATLEVGDLLVTKSSGSSLHIGKTTLVDAHVAALSCCYSNFMQRIRLAGDLLPKLAWYVMNNSLARSQFDLLSNSTTGLANLNGTMISEILLPVASPGEQTAIAAFLDRETAKIDALIAEQEKLIALLAEKRQATIAHAVTKGLNPNAPMKDSGVAWLGEVPAHWNIVKGSHLGALFGSGPVAEEDVHEVGSLPFIKVGSLSPDGFEVANWNWYVDATVASRCTPYCDFVVFPKRGAAIFMNKVNIVRRESVIDPNLMGWKIGDSASSEYVAYLLKVRRLEELADVSTVPQINNKHIEPEKFPRPPLKEQFAIVEFLALECSRLDLLRAQAERAITLLKERRSALIAAAVTGQIDVRNAPLR